MYRLSNDEYEVIKQAVVLNLDRCHMYGFPLDGIEWARRLGIIVVPYSKLSPRKKAAAEAYSKDGFFIEPEYGKEYIFYNDEGYPPRVNRTILHEICHCILDHPQPIDPIEVEKLEAEADFGAKYAAAPPPVVDLKLPTGWRQLKDNFGLSDEAAKYSFELYQKWVARPRKRLKDYEKKLLGNYRKSLRKKE